MRRVSAACADSPRGRLRIDRSKFTIRAVAGFSAFAGCEIAQFAVLLKELPERERQAFPSDLNILAEDIAARIQAVESL